MELLKRSVSLGELITAFITILIVVITSYTSMKEEQANHEIRIQHLENMERKTDDKYQQIDSKIDRLTEAVYEIKADLKNKEDKQ